MRLHNTVVKKLLRLYELHGGRRDERKLVEALSTLELSEYEQESKKVVLVLTDELTEEKQKAKKRF